VNKCAETRPTKSKIGINTDTNLRDLTEQTAKDIQKGISPGRQQKRLNKTLNETEDMTRNGKDSKHLMEQEKDINDTDKGRFNRTDNTKGNTRTRNTCNNKYVTERCTRR
jgi:hypothetical protein